MRNPRVSPRLIVTMIAMTLLLAVLPSTSPAQATGPQQNEIVLSVIYDGLQPNGDPPFAANTDGMHTPGDDDNQNNNVVRSNDLIGYRIDWNVNEVDGTMTTITATLPEGMSWIEDPGTSTGVPTGCVDDATSSITGNDGRDLVCNTDAEHEGSNGVIRPIATAGSQFDATELTMQAFIGTDQTPPVGSNTITIWASARPKADWVKGKDVLAGDPPVVVAQEPAEEIHGVTDPATGEVGRIWLYPLRLRPVGGLVSAEKMDDSQDIEFWDHAYQMPPGAKLATGLVPDSSTGTVRTACGPYDGTDAFAVGSTGTWTCTDETATASTGYPVTKVTISGHDTSVPPAVLGDGSANNAGEILVGQIAFFVPESGFTSFPQDIYNAMSGTIDAIAAPSDIAPVQVWGSAPASFDEAGVVNNYAYWKATEVPADGGPGRSFRHTVKYNNGPYQELSKTFPDGRNYRGFDGRRESVGGKGPSVTNTANDPLAPGWGVAYASPMSQISPRGNDLVISAELDHIQTSPTSGYYYEPSSLCVNIDPTHQELVALPAQFDVNELVDTSHPFAYWAQPHDSTTQESSNTGPLAQVQIGAHPNYSQHVFSYTHLVESTLVDIPYVVEFAAGLVAPDQNTAINDVTCNNADVDGRGWVDSAGDLSVFDTNADGRYEDITHVRLRVTGPMRWRGTTPNPFNRGGSESWGTSINLNLQVRVKDDPLVNQADQELFVYASRAYTPAATQGSPDGVNVWDPATQANPGTETCTNTTNTVFRNHYGDGVDHNTLVPNGWCNLPYEDDGASSNDLSDNPYDFGGGGQDAYELCQAVTYISTGCYPRMIHADKVAIVEADTAISKTNLAGANDVNQNGDLVEFEIVPRIVGSNLDTLSDVIVTDVLPAKYEFVAFTQNPVTTTNTNATTPPNNDGTALASPVCSIAGQTISCDFGTQVGGWSDTIRYQVRVVGTLANETITNTVRINANDALSGLAKSPKTAFARSFTPDEFDESGIMKMVERHIGPCGSLVAGPGDGPAEQAADCSVIAADSSIRFSLDAVNEGLADLDNYRVIDVLPHNADAVEPASATLTGDGRTPVSAFGGTLDLVAFTAPGATVLYSADPAVSISRDPDVSETANTWCDAAAGGAAVFGAGACPATAADVTAVYADLGVLTVGETRTMQLDLVTAGNECGDLYTNSFGARTDSILLPIRSNDVSTFVGFCEPEVDIEKDTNGVQADNVDEDVNGNGVLDEGEDTNDENGVLDSAAPAGSNIGPGVPVGGEVTWTYVVTNGDVALMNAVVADSDPAVTVDCDIDGDGTFDGTNVVPVLMPLAEITCQATGVAVAGQYSNNSTVTGTPVTPTAVDPAIDPADPTTWPDDPDFDPEDESTWPLDPAIDLADPSTWPTDPAGYGAPIDPVTGESMFPATLSDEDPSHYWGLPNEVGVDIEKDTNGDQADATFGPSIPVGGEVTWTYVVTNTGQLPITPATVTDSDPTLTVVCEASLGDTGGDNIIDIFQPGESVTCTATGVATGGNYENTATVSGPTSLPAGSCVCDPTDPASWPTSAGALTPNVDPATGEPITVEDTDDSHYNGAAPAIDIEKTTNGVQSDDAPGEELVAGSTVTWTYEVVNTGTTALVDAVVTDDQGVTITCVPSGSAPNVIPFMLPGQSATCTGTGPAVVGGYTNNSSVSGQPQMPDFATCGCDPTDPATWPTTAEEYSDLLNPDGTSVAPVTDADPSNYTGITDEAGIDIEKSTNGVQSDEAPGESLLVGSPVTWTYDVTNTGPTALANATVVDSQGVVVDCGDGTNVIALLLPSATVTCTGTGVAVGGPYANDSTVSGDPVVPDFGTCGCDPADSTTWPTDATSFQPAIGDDGLPLAPVTDADPSHYTGVTEGAGIDIEKSTNGVDSDEAPGEMLPAGSTVTWTYVVTNTGTTALANAAVTDSEGVAVSCDGGSNVIALLLPGQSVICEGTGTAVGGPYMNDSSVSGDPVTPDFSTCGCDPADPATWPTDPASFVPAVGEDGMPLAPVADADPSHYTGTQMIAGTVWDDLNGDGIFDEGETVHAGVLVELLDADGNPVLDADGNPITAITDENGDYSFNVAPGSYQLQFTPPEGLNLTTAGIISVDVQPGVDVPDLDAGLDNGIEPLAFTGTTSTTTVVVGMLLLGLGFGLATLGVRRRKTINA